MARGMAWAMALCLWAACVADLSGLVAAAQLPPSSLLDLTEADATAPHQRFVTLLLRAKASFTSANKTLAEADAAHSLPSDSVSAQRAAAASALVPQALRSLTEGLTTLKRVRADVAETHGSVMRSDVKMQVLWDIDRMTADAERLHTASLAPLARTALVKALSLRFGVLLTPAFWTTPINRGLLESSSTGGGSGTATSSAASPSAAKAWLTSGPAMAAAVPPPA